MKTLQILFLAIFLTALAPEPLFGQPAPDLPYWDARQDASGKYGYFDESGNCVIPCVFDKAYALRRNEKVALVEHAGKYYLIDRAGFLVMEEGLDRFPRIFSRFIDVAGYEQSYIADFHGRRISPEGLNIEQPLGCSDDNPVLFGIRKPGQSGLYLSDLNFKPLSRVMAKQFYSMTYERRVVEYCMFTGSIWEPYGLMNAAGEVLIEANPNYRQLDEFCVDKSEDWKKWMREAGIYDLYTEEELNEVILIRTSGKSKAIIYDITGLQLVPEHKNGKLSRTDFNRYIIPYLRRKEENRARFEEKVVRPYERCEQVAREVCARLPEDTPGEVSLVAQLCAGETAPAKMQNSVRESVATQGYSAAECYQKGMEAYRSRNYATAATWLEKAAESNYAAAYFPLAECYDLSESPVLDEEKACRWYMRAIGSADESSREYWHACLRIAEYFEFGKGGLERNYDSALHFYGRFRQNTLAQNRTVADSCIARVKEKQNRGSQAEVAASTPGSVPDSSENVVRGHENFAPVSLPAYGTIPETPQTLYYLNTKGQVCEIRLTTSAQGVFVSFFPSTLLKSSACLSDQSGDKFVFSEYKLDTRPISNGFGQYTPHVGVIFGRPLLSISKDWRRVTIHTLAYECDIPVTEADYKRFLEAKRDFIIGGAPGGAGGAGVNRGGSPIDTDTDGQFPGNKHGYYTCPNCHGSGRCPHCDGKKIAGNPYLGGEPMVCAPCNGKGKCASCDGTGKKYGVVH